MKNIYKKIALSFAAFAACTNIFATDLCVAENGTGGCYPTITDALNAAVNGDRILVSPKSGNAAYVEDLNITKSIQILSNTEAVQFTMQGNIIIVPANGRIVTIVGMNNLTGSVYPTANCPAGPRCAVKIMNCNFSYGAIKFDYDNFDVAAVSNVITDGYIFIRYGKVIGNDIKTTTNYVSIYSSYYPTSIYIGQDAAPTNDTIMVVGNKVNVNYSYGYASGILENSGSQFYYFSNNLITNICGSGTGIALWTTKSSALGRNSVINNTTSFLTVPGNGITVSAVANSFVDVYNNLILGQSGVGISANAQCGVSFNYMNNPLTLTGVVNDGTNNLSSNTTLAVTGKPNAGSDAINGGYPDKGFYDINLTVNDAGAYGGSFTLDNYFPVTGAARVYMISAPRKVTVGTSINVTADGFDR